MVYTLFIETEQLFMKKKPSELKKDYAYRAVGELLSNMASTDSRLPSEPVLAAMLGVSRVTLRNALSRLEKEHRIVRSHYYGTYRAGEEKRLLIVCQLEQQKETDNQFVAVPLIEKYAAGMGFVCEKLPHWFLEDAEKISKRYQGVALFGAATCGDEPFINVLKECTIPVVLFREDYTNPTADCFASVGVCKNEAWYYGIDYLAKLGFRKILSLISNNPERNYNRMGLTLESYTAELRRRNLPEAAEMIVPAHSGDLTRFAEAIEKFSPEAIYCYSDYYALHLYGVLKKMKLRIPEDVAVLGFGGMTGGNLLTPPLASVDLSKEACAEAIVQLLLNSRLSHRKPPLALHLPCAIRQGESCRHCNLENLMVSLPDISPENTREE